MKACFVVSPIIRGYTFRTFGETHSPESRYSDVAGWLQLSPLVEVQKNLRLLRRNVKVAAESTTEQDRIAKLLWTETAQAVQAWDNGAVLGYINANVIAPLDPAFTLTALAVEDEGYIEVGKRVEAEEKRVGLAGLKHFRNSVVALWQKTVHEDGGDAEFSGAIAAFGKALRQMSATRRPARFFDRCGWKPRSCLPTTQPRPTSARYVQQRSATLPPGACPRSANFCRPN